MNSHRPGDDKLTIVQIAILAILGAITCLIFGVAGTLLLDRRDSATPTVVAGELQTPRATAPLLPTRTSTPAPTPTFTPTPIPTPTSPSAPALVPTWVLKPGWTSHEYTDDGFSIALPDTWVQMDMGAKTVESALAPVKKYYPDFEMPHLEAKSIADIRADGIRLLAFDTESKSGRVASVNVFLQSLSGFLPGGKIQDKDKTRLLDTTVKAIMQGQAEQGEEMLYHQRITLPVGEAEEFHITETDEIGPQVIVQYLFLHQEALCMVTFSAASELLTAYTPIFDEIIHSFRWME
jgi:hypothetical protein